MTELTTDNHERRIKALEARRFAPTDEFWSLAGLGVLSFLLFSGMALWGWAS